MIDLLQQRGYRVVGPTPRDGAVVYDEVSRVEELPVGFRETQAPGSYRVEFTGRELVFDVVNGPGSLKRFFFAPREILFEVEIDGASFRVHETTPKVEKTAFLGVRACDLAAVAIQDRVFLQDRYPDPYYKARRTEAFVVAVNCTRAASTCFCASMKTGPEATTGFDLALTEFEDGFLVRVGTSAGEELSVALDLEPASNARLEEAKRMLDECASSMQRALDTQDLPNLLYENLEHPHWDDVAQRCLSCANCTLVCPTCFCHDERDEPSTDGQGSVRVREWDSCFNPEHSRVHGFHFHPQIKHRYRQWLVHKLASWIDQFGSSGCVGCGRCITWCPVGIDLTQEIATIRQGES